MRKLKLWQTAGFSERSHKYFMKVQNNNSECLKVMNRGFPWWGSYRYQSNPVFTNLFSVNK